MALPLTSVLEADYRHLWATLRVYRYHYDGDNLPESSRGFATMAAATEAMANLPRPADRASLTLRSLVRRRFRKYTSFIEHFERTGELHATLGTVSDVPPHEYAFLIYQAQ